MASMTSIQPGASVRDRTGLIGTVERVEDPDGPGGVGSSLIVRQEDGAQRYAFPLQVVGSIRQAEGQQFIQLDLDRAELRRYLIGAGAEGAAAGTTVARDAQTIRVPLASEELVTEVRPTERGTLRIHKGVEEVERGTEVPVQSEDVEIEHLSPEQYDPTTPTQPDEWIIPVHEERLLIRKQTVVKEYLRIRKRQTTKQVPVRDTLRREYVELNERGPDGEPLAPGSLLHEAEPDQSGRESR